MTASSPRTSARSRRLIGIGAAALLAVPASLVLATPAHAAEPGSATFDSASVSEWTVPAGVREVVVTALGGSGGNASGQHGGAGGFGASVESVLTVEPGDVLDIWAGQAGANAGSGRTENGAGGTGFVAGGNGARSGDLARPGAGGGGASAVAVNDETLVIAGGGGGGGGRGADDSFIFGDACYGGAGGNAGADGAAGYTTGARGCTIQNGGAAGSDAFGAGGNATNVPDTTFPNAAVGGAGGGGAGAGNAGPQNLGPFLARNGGGGGGGGGASLGDVIGVAAAAGNGSVVLEWEVAYTTAIELGTSPEPSVIGETVEFTALVANTETDATPVGDLTFDFGNEEIVTVPLEATEEPGVASATVERASITLGVQDFSAWYTPTEGSPFAGTEAGGQFDVERGDTLTVLDVQPVDPAYFDTLRATATVSVVDPAVSVLDGYVAFFNGEELVEIVAVDPATGEAAVEFPATAVGEVEVWAFYGDDSFLNASEDVVLYDAHAAATTTELKASAKEVAHGGKVKFEAAVTSSVVAPVEELPQTGDVEVQAAVAPVEPAGVVRFTVGEKVLGEVVLSANGTAALETAALPTGEHEIVAHFVSSVPELASSHSEAVKVTVAAAKGSGSGSGTGLASTGVDAGLLGGGALLALLLIGLGAAVVIRRRQTA
ncbi:Ig-like domain-containing protein [Agromyces aerolatus]|uniref:Ig-like domain-containing protein n=1 Tax=Agromyces sp. LY-1074 TaxID=3074080 RepID=UPI002855D210|nr:MULTISPECIES: Ig-like domain-containing protein [unclassified Agromyces]MDR5701470.1 Ig-like domain-containing protein [Agromyces sp. LY-1074]MDR5704463.1 Ig-like domain-containing protein [Agromyces sp. LY-1358]